MGYTRVLGNYSRARATESLGEKFLFGGLQNQLFRVVFFLSVHFRFRINNII